MKQHLQNYAPALGVFSLALIICLIYNLTVGRHYTPVYDAALYNLIGHDLVTNHCFCIYQSYGPSVSRPPLWPFILAALYFVTGRGESMGRLFYSFLVPGTCVLIYFFARDLFGRKIALLTGILAAIYPCMFIYAGWLYTEALFTFLLTACVYVLYRLQNHPVARSAAIAGESWFKRAWSVIWQERLSILCGILIGLTALTRPNGIFLIGLVALWTIFMAATNVYPWKILIRQIMIIICITAILVLPWTYRNYQVTHKVVLISMGMGEVLKGAYDDTVYSGDLTVRGQWRPPSGSLNHDSAGYTPANDTADTITALNWIRSHLNAMPYLLSLHFLNMWIPYTYSHGLAFEELANISYYSLMVRMIDISAALVIFFAFLGLCLTWRKYKYSLLAIYLVLLFIIGENIVFYSDMRFRAPLEPVLLILAGGACGELAGFARKWFQARKKSRISVGSAQ